jgi:hypothetical protein
VILLLVSCNGDPEPQPRVLLEREDCSATDPNRQLFWGDLHVHTRYSFDAWVYDVRLTPADAYAFAMGETVQLPAGPVQLSRPLDFAAVTDHAEFLGEIDACTREGSPAYDTPTCVDYRDGDASSVQLFGTKLALDDPDRHDDICEAADCSVLAGSVWTRTQRAAEQAYDRSADCRFTSFVGYEWTGATGVSNYHRNVIFRNEAVPELPTSYFEEPTASGLWNALDRECLADPLCDVLTIPHNSNLSNGNMFPADPEDAELRASLEVLLEVYQHKGDSECRPEMLGGVLGSEDELCSFEKVRKETPEDCGEGTGYGGMTYAGCASRNDFARGILLAGLENQGTVNPYRLGLMASTDTHSGTPGAVEEEGWLGHLGNAEDDPEERLRDPLLNPGGNIDSPGGLIGVWADHNDRDALFDAMLRREVYGTSGPRIALRFFGGDLDPGLCEANDFVDQAYENGVPMGGILNTDTFAVLAFADPLGADLATVQIVKGWVDDEGSHIEVIDVAEGPAASLCAVWTDPSPQPTAFYYARVLEVETPRWSTLDCETVDHENCDQLVENIQERAWSSPIWSE